MSRRSISKFQLFITLILFLQSGFSYSQSSPGLIKREIMSIGLKRSYYLHLPENYNNNDEKLPVLFVLHGGGNRGDGKTLANRLNFNSLADSSNFIAVYPNGIDGIWNDGRGITFEGPGDTTINDVGFISDLIDQLINNYNADAGRIYVTGLSNGGMMTLRLGCELSSKIAAIAPVIANFPRSIFNKCHPKAPVPILIMNGTNDPLVPWNGGYVKFFRRKMGKVVSTKETVQFWVRHNQCDTIPIVQNLPDTDKDDQSSVVVTTYPNKKYGAEVVLYTIKGGGHTLPGSNMPDRPFLLGRKNNDIVGEKVILKFFNIF